MTSRQRREKRRWRTKQIKRARGVVSVHKTESKSTYYGRKYGAAVGHCS